MKLCDLRGWSWLGVIFGNIASLLRLTSTKKIGLF